MYANSRGVHRNDKEAVKWFHKAAEQNDPNAEYNLGVLYLEGKGVPQSDEEAMKWLRKSAAQGFPRARELLNDSTQPTS